MKSNLLYIVVFYALLMILSTEDAVPQYQLDPVFTTTTFSKPLEMVEPMDGTDRIFVIGQRGKITVLNTAQPVRQGKVFLDLSDIVPQSGFEKGLLGMAFHPDYSNNMYFYVYYSLDSPTRSVIARYEVSSTNPDSAVKSSEVRILVDTISVASHFGGKIGFGPDDYLYISFGMGAGQNDPPNNAQNLSLLRGKILRINIDSSANGNNYAIPADNPFVDSTSGERKEIFAWGFRNVWKFCFDEAGRILAGDVGQFALEEIDIVERGRNYGWRIMEGTNCFNPNPCDTTGLAMPVFQYPRSEGISITGGYVSTSPTLPSLVNKYIYGDYGSGKIWALSYDGVTPATSQLLVDSPNRISSFGKDKDGNIYVCNISGNNIFILRDLTVNIVPINQGVPSEYSLRQNYPNPFNPKTSIEFSVPESGFVRLKVFDATGRETAILFEGFKDAGSYNVKWNAGNFPSGVYFYRLESDNYIDTKKLVLMK